MGPNSNIGGMFLTLRSKMKNDDKPNMISEYKLSSWAGSRNFQECTKLFLI